MFDFLEKIVTKYEISQSQFEVDTHGGDPFIFMLMYSKQVFWTMHFIALFFLPLLLLTIPAHLFYNKCMEQVFDEKDKMDKEMNKLQKEYDTLSAEEERRMKREELQRQEAYEQYLRDVESGKITRYDEDDINPYSLQFNEKTGKFEMKEGYKW